MKNTLFYITGTSKGIGKALALNALEKGATVIGIARSKSIEHQNYTHYSLDLSDVKKVTEFSFARKKNFDKIVLINNAGRLGKTSYVGNLEPSDIQKSIDVNLTSPFILLNNFVKAYKDHPSNKFILNMSSGAGKHPYDGWASYCSTKAALDMITRVLEKELSERKNETFKIYACSPGVVETNMQNQIRNSETKYFSSKDRFISMHENGENKTPEVAARELISLISSPEKFKDLFPDFWQGA